MSAGLTTSEIPKLDKASRSVAWWSVNAYVEPLLAAVGQWPMAGTPEWCELPENDARKIAAIYDAAHITRSGWSPPRPPALRRHVTSRTPPTGMPSRGKSTSGLSSTRRGRG
jgi:hypothetical protein